MVATTIVAHDPARGGSYRVDVAIEGARIPTSEQLMTEMSLAGVLPAGATVLLMNHRPGTTATLGISRAGVAQTIKVVVGAGP